MSIINPNKPIIQDIPTPQSEDLKYIVQKLWEYCITHTHDLLTNQPTTLDQFCAACIKVVCSNLKAIDKLEYMYFEECNAICRNLVESCVDYFWVSGIYKAQPEKGERLAANFYLFSCCSFLRDLEFNKKASYKDPFLRDLKLPFYDEDVIKKCEDKIGSRIFGKAWREEDGYFTREDVTWAKRCEIAKEFVASVVNLKSAPYLQNLKSLSSFSHFDPMQLQNFEFDSTIKQRYFDRMLNIMIGYVFDMLIYSYLRKNWEPPQDLLVLQHKFCWFST